MSILSTLLTLPVSGPVRGVSWIASKIHDAALEQHYDPARITAALMALEAELEAGRIDEATFEETEAALLVELREIKAYRAQVGAGDGSNHLDEEG